MKVIGRARRCVELIEQLEHYLTLLAQQGEDMSQQLDDLTAQVRANTSLLASAVSVIQGIADRITAAGTDAAALAALTAELRASDASLAGAIAANTNQAAPG